MTKSLAFTLVAVLSCLPFFGQDDINFDCQDDSTCDLVVDFAFTLDANQEDALTFPFTGTIAGGGVIVTWPGGGTSYPSDLSLSLCSPDGDCVAIAGYGGSLPGTPLGGWPTNWNNVVAGDNVACFSFGDLTLSGDGTWTLTGLNSYSSSAAGVLFEGSVTLFTDCTPQPDPCTDDAACNFGALEDCTYPGCLKPAACNYNPDAGCSDDSSCTYDYCSECLNAACELDVPFNFSLGPNEQSSFNIPYTGELVGCRVVLDWLGGGLSFPADLSLSFCTGGACVAIEGYDGILPGDSIGAWPANWENDLDGSNEACFSFSDLSLFGDGELTLTGLNTYGSSSQGVVFEGTITLLYLCNSGDECTDETACNFGALTDCVFPGCTDAGACNFDEAAGCDDGGCDYACLGCMDVAACNYNPEATQSDGSCTYPGCNDPEACNYDETAGCDDGTCEYEQHIFVPNTDGTYGSPVLEWCGPLPDCSNPIIGCPIPGGYIEVDHPCVELILENLATCGASWTPTCALELLLCTQYDLGCTNEAACNFNPDAGYDDNSCVFPGTPCDDGIDCTTDDILNLQCECEGQITETEGEGPCSGCTDPSACNYSETAQLDDGSCDFCSCGVPPSIAAAGTVDSPDGDQQNRGYTLLATDGQLLESRLLDAGFIALDEMTKYTAVEGAGSHLLALSEDSAVVGFGVNASGVLDIPQELPPIVRIETGTRHALALDASGALTGWGETAHGQLELGDMDGLAGISAGHRHSMAWDSSGAIVLAVGNNQYGQLNAPQGLSVTDLACANHVVALLSDSSVVCWGSNTNGQCDVPAAVDKAIAVAASRYSSMALLADSTVVVWGRLQQLETFGKVQAIDGNASRDVMAVLDADGYPHILAADFILNIQMRNASILALGEGRCTTWCVDRDGDGLCDAMDDCIGEEDGCDCVCLEDENNNGVCDSHEVRGCRIVGADNYSPYATISGPCEYSGSGCVSPLACNYDPRATIVGQFHGTENVQVDGFCLFEGCGGCTDPFGCNYDMEAKWDDGSCDYTSCTGCDDINACNYNPKVLPADSCDYCSCHVVEPMVNVDFEYFLYVNSKGDARLGGNHQVILPNFSGTFAQNSQDGRVVKGVRTGDVSGPAYIFIGIDSSITVLDEDVDSFARQRAADTELEMEALHNQDVHIAVIPADLTPPEGHDFITAETHFGTYAAVRADGTLEVWGNLVSKFDDGVAVGLEGVLSLGGDEPTVKEWAAGLSDVVDVALGGFWDVIAVHGDGSMSAYGLNPLVPEGLNDVVSLEGNLLLHTGKRSDGTFFLIKSSTLAGTFDSGYVPEILDLPAPYLEDGSVVAFDATLMVRSAALLDDGRVMLTLENPIEGASTDVDPEWLAPVVIPAGTYGNIIDVENTVGYLLLLDDEGVMTKLAMADLYLEYGNETQMSGVIDLSLGLNTSEEEPLVASEWANSIPDSVHLGPPTDCYGCADSDGDGICDLVDLCDGVVDALGECGGDCLLDEDGDGVCDLLDRPGCTYEEASNFDEVAMYDDGSCVFGAAAPCPTDINADGQTNTQDLLLLLGNFGLVCD